jgi:hypothetical protein
MGRLDFRLPPSPQPCLNSTPDMARKARRKRSPSLPLDGPTRERLNHGGLITVPGDRAGTFLRVAQSPLDRYAARDEISPRQYAAGQRLRQHYELGILGISRSSTFDLDRIIVRHRTDEFVLTEARLAAIEDFRGCVAAMGPTLAEVVLAIVADEKTAEAIGEMRAINGNGSARRYRDIAKLYFAAGLDRLADHLRLAPDYVAVGTAERIAAEMRTPH